jgi:hypothetical protein
VQGIVKASTSTAHSIVTKIERLSIERHLKFAFFAISPVALGDAVSLCTAVLLQLGVAAVLCICVCATLKFSSLVQDSC